MLTSTVLYVNSLLRIRHVACRHAPKEISDVERQDANTLIFPIRGVFVEHFSPGYHVLAEPNITLVFPSARSCRVSHPVASEDECLVMEFSPESFDEVLLEASGRHIPPSIGTHHTLSPSAIACRHILWRRLEGKSIGPFEIEETCLAMLAAALRNVCEKGRRQSTLRQTGPRIQQQMEAARIAILTNPQEKWTLTSLAHMVECSPFHLTRMFCRDTGLPLHRFLLHARLCRAIDLLLDSQQDLTTLALCLGFSSHSHFTSIFRQKIGIPPSEFRNTATTRQVARARKML